MIKKLLFLGILSILFNIYLTSVNAIDITVVLPGNSTPSPTISSAPTTSPLPTVQPTVSSSPTATPLIPLPPTPSAISSSTPHGTSSPSPTATTAPGVGGVSTTSSPFPTVNPTASPTPLKSVETILKTEPKTTKPIIQDIRANAYNTLLDSPLAFLVSDGSRTYYHPHGLSSLSTKILLSLGLSLCIAGFMLINFDIIQDFLLWRKEQPRRLA
jgi:hypothetical protein